VPSVVNYKLVRGLPWSRQLTVKSRRTRWRLAPEYCNAYIQISTLRKKEITSEVIGNNNIRISLTADETIDLPEGNLAYDVWATVDDLYQPVVKGTITVSTYANITPSEDDDTMELRYTQRTDFRRAFEWKDEEGELLVIQSAFMQAKDTSGTTVLDLRWYNPAPNEATVIALTPAKKRGYLAPQTGKTLTMHISNKNDIAAGSYDYDIFVQDTLGDWDQLVEGTLIVESAISEEPV